MLEVPADGAGTADEFCVMADVVGCDCCGTLVAVEAGCCVCWACT